MKKLFLFAMLICSAYMVSNAQNTSGNCYREFVDVDYDVGIGDYDFGPFVTNNGGVFWNLSAGCRIATNANKL